MASWHASPDRETQNDAVVKISIFLPVSNIYDRIGTLLLIS